MTAARRARSLGVLLGAAALAGDAGCGRDWRTVDSLPIPLGRAPRGDGMGQGALLARASIAGGAPVSIVVDTASPITIVAGPGTGTVSPRGTDIDILDASFLPAEPRPIRARFRGIGAFALPLGAQGDAATLPDGVLGGDSLLRAFSVELRFGPPCAPTAPGVTPAAGCAALTFWRHQGASTGFLSDAGYAVLRFTPMGGGETSARTQPDSLGLTAPVALPPTRVVMRVCAASTDDPLAPCCQRGDEITNAKGVDLALVLATGAGPLVLSRAAFDRVAAKIVAEGGTAPPDPAATPLDLHMASWPTPIPAGWSAIPRFALVDLQAGTSADPGPCVELARARRIELVAQDQQKSDAAGTDVAACVQTCDTDPAEAGKAQDSAAYVELSGVVPVAVVDNAAPFLQALRFDVRPEGPEVDGLVGAGALAGAHLELDYLSETPRAIFSCEAGAEGVGCRASPHCPRLPDREQTHLCFGLPAHRLPPTCAPSACP